MTDVQTKQTARIILQGGGVVTKNADPSVVLRLTGSNAWVVGNEESFKLLVTEYWNGNYHEEFNGPLEQAQSYPSVVTFYGHPLYDTHPAAVSHKPLEQYVAELQAKIDEVKPMRVS